MSEPVNAVSGNEYGEVAEKGDVIRVPQYKNALEVVFRSSSILGVEFNNPAIKNHTNKHIIVNENTGRLYLIAGQSDKGEVESVTVVTRSS
jgi:hypothetical protein